MKSSSVRLSLAEVLTAAGVTSPGGYCGASSPRAGLSKILAAVQEGNWQQAAGIFLGGFQIMDTAPERMMDYLLHVTDGALATCFTVLDEQVEGGELRLRVETSALADSASPLRRQTWHFRRRGLGWVVVEVTE